MTKQQTTIHLDHRHEERLEQLAKEMGVSRSAVVRKVIDCFWADRSEEDPNDFRARVEEFLYDVRFFIHQLEEHAQDLEGDRGTG